MPHNTEKIRQAYKSKYNLNLENQLILLMITDGEKWHYLAVKSLSALFREKTGNNNGEFDCLNCFQSYTTENKLKKHKKVCENNDCYYVEMPEECNKILKYKHGEKPMKVPFIIYADLESLLENMNTCHNNPEKSSTTKINKHTLSGYSLFTLCSFDTTKNKLNYYRGKIFMRNFCLDLREHATKIINYENKEMIPLTKEEKEFHSMQKVFHICKRIFSTNYNNKKYHKVKDHSHYTGKYRSATHDICNLRDKIPKEIPVVFHNGSTYDYHFIIKELAEEFEREFECLGENIEKYRTFSVPIKKEITKKDKDGNDKTTKISYKIKFIDSFRFISSSLSSLAHNLSEGLHNDRCTDCKSYLDYMASKDEKLIFRCFECKRNYEKYFNKELIKKFANIYEFCNCDINKFILLLRKDIYPYEYMSDWNKFNNTELPPKDAFYSNLNMEDITDVDDRHEKRVIKSLSNKNLGDYHDFYVQSDTLLLADVFENFRNMCIKVYELDPAHFLSAPGLAWQACLKKIGVELELLTDPDMLLMVEKGIRGGICHKIFDYAKANSKYMKNYDENEESSFLEYLDANNLYGWAMSEPLPVNCLDWMEDLSKIDEHFIKNYDEDSNKGYRLDVDNEYLKNVHDLHSDLPYLPERMKVNKCNKLVCNLYDKESYIVQIRSLKQA